MKDPLEPTFLTKEQLQECLNFLDERRTRRVKMHKSVPHLKKKFRYLNEIQAREILSHWYRIRWRGQQEVS